MNQINLTLPLPPSANRYWRKTRNGQIYVSSEAKEFIKTVKIIAATENAKIITGNVKLELKIFRRRKAGDLDNFIKICADSLQGICFENDSQIVEIHATRFDDKTNPRCEINVINAIELL